MIPKAALEMKLPVPDDMTLDDLEMLFEAGGAKPARFKEFMSRYSNWTEKEVGRLTRKEAREIFDKIVSDVLESLIPKGNAAPS